MYEFHYKYIKSKYNFNLSFTDTSSLLFTDTSSLVHELETVDVYEDFYEDKNLFDFSDYSYDSKFFNPVNKSYW